jgi:hypothetical protein
MSERMRAKLAAMSTAPVAPLTEAEKLRIARLAARSQDPRDKKPDSPLKVRLGTPVEDSPPFTIAAAPLQRAANKAVAQPSAGRPTGIPIARSIPRGLGQRAAQAASSAEAARGSKPVELPDAVTLGDQVISPVSLNDALGTTVIVPVPDSGNTQTLFQDGTGLVPIALYANDGRPYDAIEQSNGFPVFQMTTMFETTPGTVSVGSGTAFNSEAIGDTYAMLVLPAFVNGAGNGLQFVENANPLPVVETSAAPKRLDHADLDYLAEKIALLIATARVVPAPTPVLGTKCETCGEMFMNEVCLAQHRDAKHPSGVQAIVRCIVCGAYFSSESSLSQHASVHATPK